MKNRSIWGFAFILGLVAPGAQAQSPAEMPPASYDGAQYVDSKGCVFLRVTIDGQVSWAPRVDRTRAPVCNHPPSVPGTMAVATVEAPAEDSTVVAVVPAPAAPAVKAKTVRVSKPRYVKTPKTTVAVRRVQVSGPPVGTVYRKEEIPPGVRVVPRHVYEQNKGTRVQVVVPEGYRPAFNDDRLNPRRAEMNRAGIYATEGIWTNTVPRELRTGETLSDGSSYASTPVVSSKGRAAGAQERVSSRSTPAAASGHRYVQVGSFGQPANADKAARRLKAAGLPVRYGKYRNGQGELRVVLAGPFASKAEVAQALATARRAGFADAFSR